MSKFVTLEEYNKSKSVICDWCAKKYPEEGIIVIGDFIKGDKMELICVYCLLDKIK